MCLSGDCLLALPQALVLTQALALVVTQSLALVLPRLPPQGQVLVHARALAHLRPQAPAVPATYLRSIHMARNRPPRT